MRVKMKNDFTGRRFGKLTVIEPTTQRSRGAVIWRCRCDCGNEVLVESRRLSSGVAESCGCDRPDYGAIRDLTGLRFGKLVVLGKSGNRTKDRNPLWRCRCDCGNEFTACQSNLQVGQTTSCGCKQRERSGLHFVDGTFVEGIQSKTISRANTSGVRGVYFNKKRGKWIAQIMFKGKCYYLGGYDKLENAAKARARGEEMFDHFLDWYQNKDRELRFEDTNGTIAAPKKNTGT